MDRFDISINLCTYNRAEMLRNTLTSLTNQETNGEFTFEIVVIDDGSTDTTREILENISMHSGAIIRYFREERVGVAAARNRGVAESRGEWIAFIDDDEIAERNWLIGLYTAALKTGGDCIGGQLKFSKRGNTENNLVGIQRKLFGEKVDIGYFKNKLTYTGPGAGNVLVRRKIFDEIGLFDPLLIVVGEDQDFFRRARKLGFKIVYTPNAIVHHIIPLSRTKPEYFIKSAKQCGKSSAYFDYKEWGYTKTLCLCFIRILHAIFVTIPKLMMAYIVKDDNYILSGKCSLYVVSEYSRWVFIQKLYR